MARKPTAQDVADLAGVSRTAVSLVLNGRGQGNISAANQRAIRAAARQLHYTPNAVALSLRSRQSHTLGVLVWGGPRLESWVILYAALQTAARHGYLAMIMDTRGEPRFEQEAIETLAGRQVDGFLVISPERGDYRPPPGLLAVPTVLANCTDPARAVTSVTTDQPRPGAWAELGEQAVRLLVDEIAHQRHESRAIVIEQAVIVEDSAEA